VRHSAPETRATRNFKLGTSPPNTLHALLTLESLGPQRLSLSLAVLRFGPDGSVVFTKDAEVEAEPTYYTYLRFTASKWSL
jgi:hypothetical protein